MALLERVEAVATRRRVLWTLVERDLRVRYSQSALGYLWTVLDPLLMSLIYFVVFALIFKRTAAGYTPYFLFLLTGLLSWQWFSGSLTDTSRALLMESRLVRSTKLPRELWVVRVVVAKTIEYILALPVLIFFVVFYVAHHDVHLNDRLVLFPLGVALEFVLLIGLGLLLAPVTVLVTDTQRIIRIVLRVMFYLTPILYAKHMIPQPWEKIMWLNPMNGVLELLRAGFFKESVNWPAVGVGLVVSLLVLVAGQAVFSRMERAVLKEI